MRTRVRSMSKSAARRAVTGAWSPVSPAAATCAPRGRSSRTARRLGVRLLRFRVVLEASLPARRVLCHALATLVHPGEHHATDRVVIVVADSLRVNGRTVEVGGLARPGSRERQGD